MTLRPPAVPGRRPLRVLFPLLVGVQVLLGTVWTIQNLGVVAEYGDTSEYLELAGTLRIDAYRGIGYPALLAGVNRVSPRHDLLAWRPSMAGDVPAGVLIVQGLQMLSSIGALAYFLRVLCWGPWPVGAPRARVSGLGLAALLLLLISDPLVAHFNLSLLTDGLALSASLVFCAAMADFVLGASPRRVSGLLVVVSALVASSLRSEKPLVIVGTVLVTVAAWLYVARREPPRERRASRSRFLQAAAMAIGAVLVVVAGQASVRVQGTRMSVEEWILIERVVFPHLESVYERLPSSVQSRISRDAARRYDSHVNEARLVVEEATGDDTALRRTLTQQMAAVVVRSFWAAIAVDSLKDTLENLAATPSFYIRLALAGVRGLDERRIVGSAHWTYSRLSQAHPVTSRLYLLSAIVLLVVASVLTLTHFGRSRRPGTPRIDRRTVLAWTPVAAFALMNALAFALTADFVHVRYVLFAHVVLLGLIYEGALAWAPVVDAESDRVRNAAVSPGLEVRTGTEDVRASLPIGGQQPRPPGGQFT